MKKNDENSLRRKLYHVIFEAETSAGRAFDIVLILIILLSVFTVVIESVASIKNTYGNILLKAEVFFTVIFTIEYILRIYATPKPIKYIFSFYGLVDLLAIIPSYLSFLFPGAHSMLIIRAFRMLRIARIFKLTHFVSEGDVLRRALKASLAKIIVFIGAVITIVIIVGAVMYLVEGPEHGFSSIPTSIYWTIVTLTTVGYGDIAPGTPLGKFIASFVMIMGYGIIAVPTGIVSVELARSERADLANRVCVNCFTEGHRKEAGYCFNCGEPLIKPEVDDPVI